MRVLRRQLVYTENRPTCSGEQWAVCAQAARGASTCIAMNINDLMHNGSRPKWVYTDVMTTLFTHCTLYNTGYVQSSKSAKWTGHGF